MPVLIVAVDGGINKLPSYAGYLASPRDPRRKIITLLGCTIDYFADKVTAIRDILIGRPACWLPT